MYIRGVTIFWWISRSGFEISSLKPDMSDKKTCLSGRFPSTIGQCVRWAYHNIPDENTSFYKTLEATKHIRNVMSFSFTFSTIYSWNEVYFSVKAVPKQWIVMSYQLIYHDIRALPFLYPRMQIERGKDNTRISCVYARYWIKCQIRSG